MRKCGRIAILAVLVTSLSGTLLSARAEPRFYPLVARTLQWTPKDNIMSYSSLKPSKKSYYVENKRGWRFLVTGGPVLVFPTGTFYEDFQSSIGWQIGFRLIQTDAAGRTKGYMFAFSYQAQTLDYEPASEPQSIRVSEGLAELGRAYPIAANGSHFYSLLGLGRLSNKGEVNTNSYSALQYQEGSGWVLRLKVGIVANLWRHVGFDVSLGGDLIRIKVTYPQLGNYSETREAGQLWAFGLGMLYAF